jgi:hypothetical protein
VKTVVSGPKFSVLVALGISDTKEPAAEVSSVAIIAVVAHQGTRAGGGRDLEVSYLSHAQAMDAPRAKPNQAQVLLVTW